MGGRGGGKGKGGAATSPPQAAVPQEVASLLATMELIRRAYDKEAREPGAWVGIADIRDRLPESIPRSQVDLALRHLERADDVNIVPESNQKSLTERERRSAVVIGDQSKHFIAMRLPTYGG